MWLVGILVLTAIGVAGILALGWTPRAHIDPPPWDITGSGGTYTNIVGTLAGFSVASAIFIAGFESTRTFPLFATVIGMLLAAFLTLVFSALAYASVPNRAPVGEAPTVQTVSYALANMCGCLGLAMSWLALIPLLDMLTLADLATTFSWLLLIVTVAGSGWTALFAYRLTPASVVACLAIPIVGFALPAVYWLVLVRLWPALWPETGAPLNIAFVALGMGGLIFGLHLVLLALFGSRAVTRVLNRYGHLIVLAYSMAYTMIVALLWFAVAFG